MEDEPRVVVALKQIALSSPAIAAGNGFTVITTRLLFVQPLLLMVSTTIQVVVTSGVTVGFASVEVNPGGIELQL